MPDNLYQPAHKILAEEARAFTAQSSAGYWSFLFILCLYLYKRINIGCILFLQKGEPNNHFYHQLPSILTALLHLA